MDKLTAIIPVRAGSRRLKNKNILPFGDSNLLIRKIRQLKQVNEIDRIVVSSDSEQMLEMALNEKVSIHKRELKYADDKSVPFGETVKNICESLNSDHILWATCTSPLTKPETYSSAIKQYYSMSNDFDSLVAVEILKIFLWDDNGPINYGFGSKHVLSQDLPNIYHPTNGIFIAPRQKMIEWKYFHGVKPFKFIIDKKQAIDIDDEFDFKFAISLI